jgi:hypothetical protein
MAATRGRRDKAAAAPAKKPSPGKDSEPCRARNDPAPAWPTTLGKTWKVKFTCHECGQHFDRFTNYEKHMKIQHPSCPREPEDGPPRDPTPTLDGPRTAKADTKRKAKGKDKATRDSDSNDDDDGDSDDDSDDDGDNDDNGKGLDKGKEKETTAEASPARTRPSRGRKLKSATPDDVTLFRIFRLIRNTDKAQGSVKTMPTLSDQGSKLQWGEFLLDLSPDMSEPTPNVRTIGREEGNMAKRMLQRIDLPWGLPEELEFTTRPDGEPMTMGKLEVNVPLRDNNPVAFQRDEWVLVIRRSTRRQKAASDVYVRDFEGRPGLLKSDELRYPVAVPWNLRLEKRLWKERMDQMVMNVQDADGEGNGEGSSKSNKRQERDSPENDNGEGPSTRSGRRKIKQVHFERDTPSPANHNSKTAVAAEDDNGEDDGGEGPAEKVKKKIRPVRRRKATTWV